MVHVLARCASFLKQLKLKCIHFGQARITQNIIRFSSVQAITSIFEPIPREELVTKFKSRIRDRPFTPGSSDGGFPEFLAEPRESFPLGVRVDTLKQSSLTEMAARCMEFVEKNLSHSPAILFRGLPARSAEDFSIIAQGIPWKHMTYEGGGANRNRVDQSSATYTASNDPKEYTIEPHNEMSYMDSFPSKLFFFCVKEPADGCGGETFLVKNREILSKLDPEVVRNFEQKHIRYTRYLPDKSRMDYVHLNWQNLFTTDSKKKAESLAKELGYNVIWDLSGDLYLWKSSPAFVRHPLTGEKIWFNQAHAHHSSYTTAMPEFSGITIPEDKFPHHVYYGDGSPIEPETVQHVRATSWASAVGFQWRCGDLLVLDNLACQHGRISFTGERKLLLYLTK